MYVVLKNQTIFLLILRLFSRMYILGRICHTENESFKGKYICGTSVYKYSTDTWYFTEKCLYRAYELDKVKWVHFTCVIIKCTCGNTIFHTVELQRGGTCRVNLRRSLAVYSILPSHATHVHI